MYDKADVQKYIMVLAAGVLSALLFAEIQAGGARGAIGAYLSAAPISAVGFAFGLPLTSIAGLCGILILSLSEVFPSHIAFSFALFDCMPVMMVIGMFLIGFKKQNETKFRRFNYGTIIAALCVMMSLTMVFIAKMMVSSVSITDEEAGEIIEPVSIYNMIYVMIEAMVQKVAPELPVEHKVIVEPLAKFAPAIIVIMWLLHILIGLALSIWGVNKYEMSIRKKPEYKKMLLPYWFVIFLFMTVIGGYAFKGDNAYLANNVSVVLLFPFLLQGFTVAHMFAEKTKYPKTVMFLFYSLFAFGSAKVVLATAFLGLIENFIKLHQVKLVNNLEE